MRKSTRVLVAGLATGLLAAGLTSAVQASPGKDAPAAPPAADKDAHRNHRPDELMTPQMRQERADKQEALNRVFAGEASVQQRGTSKGVQLANGRWVQWGTPEKAQLLTFLAEFGDQTMHGGTPGPLHNQIPEPDRVWDGNATDDNSTAWTKDASRDYFQQKMYAKAGTGDSITDFYLRQSGGRYTVEGEVLDWVKLDYNEARYGNNEHEDTGYPTFVGDTVTKWYAVQKAAGKTDAQIKQFLARYDVWDRNDYDEDGDFNEPDGYLDHVQIIHSGAGEEAGGGAQGDDAIWSHSSYAIDPENPNTGPAYNAQGGYQIGDTGIWVGRYTTSPENGGLGVFVHEYAHDIGIPDYYDTRGGDNGTGFWTVMSGGSWLNTAHDNIGDRPNFMGPLEKLQLGWLDYDVVELDKKNSVHALGAAATPWPFKQATMVKLPNRPETVQYEKPFAGKGEWFSGEGDDLNSRLAREVDLTGATTASVNAKVWYDTESGYDYLYGAVSTDGKTWTRLPNRYDGNSGGWVDISFDLSAYVGKKVQFRYQYVTDGNTHGKGVMIDNVAVVKNGTVAWTDGAESGDAGWSAKGFQILVDGALVKQNPHFYLIENRQYTSYDASLRNGPYNFGFPEKADWVERFPFFSGTLVWYVDSKYGDNNTKAHPGHGMALPVDARPAPITLPDAAKTKLRNRLQGFDGAFGRKGISAVTFHGKGTEVTAPARPGVAVFDDSDPNRYWDASNPWNSVQVAGSGVKVEILLDGNGQYVPAIIKVTRTK
ncbi:immune inhibitor A domain-containing protein [Longispora albida]|uniref:immune inhibitor A domain-containing protein n=1 Tax=Longispora albida TaxID=203523 RepID=UPI0003731CD6|nr:immune inhibitor A domain-containing protein [Longispora albida]